MKISQSYLEIQNNTINLVIKISDHKEGSTELLYELLKKYEEINTLQYFPEKFRLWYEEHKKFDINKEK